MNALYPQHTYLPERKWMAGDTTGNTDSTTVLFNYQRYTIAQKITPLGKDGQGIG